MYKLRMEKRFKPISFMVTALAIIVFAFVFAGYGLYWLAGLYGQDHDRYGAWLSVEIVLSSVAFGIFIFHRQLTSHPYERLRKADDPIALADSRRNRTITWWAIWLLAFVSFSLPSIYELFAYGIQGLIRIMLMCWWAFDLAHSGIALFSKSKSASPKSRNPLGLYLESNADRNLRWQRSWLNLVVFIQCFLATIVTNSVPVWLCFTFGSLWIAAALIARIAVQPFDPRTLFGQGFLFLFRQINQFWKWDELPVWVGVANLAALREELREHNLYSTAEDRIAVTCPAGLRPIPLKPADANLRRHSDGFFNDPVADSMGVASFAPTGNASTQFTHSHPDARFGRNMPFESLETDSTRLLVPNPREISCKLLARDSSKANHGTDYARSLNLLAAAWIQFQSHDWFSHGEPIDNETFEVDTSNDPDHDRWPTQPMLVRRTRPDPTRIAGDNLPSFVSKSNLGCPMTFVNAEAHWWDASQVYGTQPSRTQSLVGNQCPFMPSIHNPSGDAKTGFFDNWWLGLGILHELFVKEHNAICVALKTEYPSWSNELIFEKARLINAALMAKIHTTEWTPAILNNPALHISMNANWSGLFTQRVMNAFGRLGLNEAFWGIPGSGINHHSAPYVLTEEFVSVYRMHSLIPDEIVLRKLSGDAAQSFSTQSGKGIVGEQGSLTAWNSFSQSDLLYSFGTSFPGSLTLNNFPNSLRRFTKPGSTEPIDIATIDILRDRERQVPRYNRFRQELRMKPIRSFDEFNTTDSPDIASRLRQVYKPLSDGRDSVDDLDLLVGTLAESKPEGFGFSDTTFRIFILMASRRLKSDRFTAEDFTPEVYSPLGIHWVNSTSMKEVLLRHYPELGGTLYGIKNAFQPWLTGQLNSSGSFEWKVAF
jgi:Animal haem peroxidase